MRNLEQCQTPEIPVLLEELLFSSLRCKCHMGVLGKTENSILGSNKV